MTTELPSRGDPKNERRSLQSSRRELRILHLPTRRTQLIRLCPDAHSGSGLKYILVQHTVCPREHRLRPCETE